MQTIRGESHSSVRAPGTEVEDFCGRIGLGIFIFAAFVTPPDAVSQSAMALPMYLLYEIGIVMAGLLLKDKIAARAKEEAENAEREAGA